MSKQLTKAFKKVKTSSVEDRVDLLIRAGAIKQEDRLKSIAKLKKYVGA